MRMKLSRLILIGVVTGVMSLATTRSESGNAASGSATTKIPAGWQLKEKTGRANFGMVDNEGTRALQLRSTNTSFSLQRQINTELKQFPILSWKWKVTKLPAGGDYRRSKTDDQ